MQPRPFERTAGGRALLRGGVVFVVVGGAAAIVVQREQWLSLERDQLPTVLAGQVVTRLPGVRVGGLMLWLHRDGPPPFSYTQNVETDQAGRFSFKGPLPWPVRVVLVLGNQPCIYRPIGPITLPSSQPLTIELVEGAAVSGRVVRHSKPVGNLVLRLRQVERDEFSIRPGAETKTDDQGRFRFVHLGEHTDFYAFTPLDSLSGNTIRLPRRLQTGADATAVDLGDIEVGKGHTLAGRVILSDGKALGPTTEISVQCLVSGTALRRKPASNGHFRFEGLPEGPMAVYFSSDSPRMSSATSPVPGYHLSPKNKSIDTCAGSQLLGRIERDVTDLTILLEPGEKPAPETDAKPADLVQSERARMEQARSHPLAGVPSGSAPGS